MCTLSAWKTKIKMAAGIEEYHEGLVTEELFRKAQKAIRVRRKREKYKKRKPITFKGKSKVWLLWV